MTRLTFRLVAVVVCFTFGSSLNYAQNQRSWVSGVGDDANPCTRTAPCKTFGAAINKTVQNGEIDVLDPGDYGFLSIFKSITIDGTGTFAGFSSPGSGISIQLGPTLSPTDTVHTVRLRGLSISGAGINSKVDGFGIEVLSDGFPDLKVIIEDSIIDGFGKDGIIWRNDGGDLVVKNSVIRNNNRAGVRVDSAGSNPVYVSIDHTVTNLNQEGVRFEDNVRGTILNSTALNNSLNGYVVIPSTAPSEMNIDNSAASNNRQNGVFSINNGAASTIRISNTEVTNNVSNGLASLFGGLICSNGKNRITAPTQPPNCTFTEQ